MSSSQDRDYHDARAQEELRLAEQADDPAIAAIHRELAVLHRRRLLAIVHVAEPQPAPLPLTVGRRLRPDS